jgi:hypothetical protein
MDEDFIGLRAFKDAFAEVHQGGRNYRLFYEMAAATSSAITLVLMQCGCVGERLPRNYRVVFHPEDHTVLLLQKFDDPWNERQNSWYTINAASDELPPRKLILNFEQDLRTGWLDELARMLIENAEENTRVFASLQAFGREALGDGVLQVE